MIFSDNSPFFIFGIPEPTAYSKTNRVLIVHFIHGTVAKMTFASTAAATTFSFKIAYAVAIFVCNLRSCINNWVLLLLKTIFVQFIVFDRFCVNVARSVHDWTES